MRTGYKFLSSSNKKADDVLFKSTLYVLKVDPTTKMMAIISKSTGTVKFLTSPVLKTEKIGDNVLLVETTNNKYVFVK